MKRFRLRLAVVVAAFLIIIPALAFSGDRHHPVRKSFFVVNPSLRADVLASDAEEKADDLLDLVLDSAPFPSKDPAPWKAPNGEKWNEIGFMGLRMSLSRLALEQRLSKGGLLFQDEQAPLPDVWPLFSRGSLGKDDLEALGGFFRPQLNLGIEF